MIREHRLSPILKWAGGKEKELGFILPNLPRQFTNYYEPFVGGGAVFFSLTAPEMYINDKSEELIRLYRMVQEQNNEFFDCLQAIHHNWLKLTEVVLNNGPALVDLYQKFAKDIYPRSLVEDWIEEYVLQKAAEFNGVLSSSFHLHLDNFIHEIIKNLVSKITRMKKIAAQRGVLNHRDIIDNIESAFKSAFYMHLRYLYNNLDKYAISAGTGCAIYYFIREYCYSSMFRYNQNGQFNVPYGGISYNRKDFAKKIEYLGSRVLHEHMGKAKIHCLDFEEFLDLTNPTTTDFIFLDPPYDSDFSTYAQMSFDRRDHQRLADYLLHKCKAKFMLVIKSTGFITDLYGNSGLNVRSFDKTYLVSFQNRNNKDAEHLMITNY